MAQAVPTPRRVTPTAPRATDTDATRSAASPPDATRHDATRRDAKLLRHEATRRDPSRALTRIAALALCWTLGTQAQAMQAAPTATTTPAPAPAPEPAAPASDETISEPRPTGAEDGSDTDNVAVIARAGLEVDTAAAGPNGPVMLTRLEELGNLELRRAEILPRRHGDDPVVHLRVELRSAEAEGYAIFSDVRVRGEVVEGSAREAQCPLCTESEAVERARGELVRLVPFVRARFRPVKKADPGPVLVAPPPKRDEGLGTLGKAGVGLVAGGAVVLGAGLGLAIADPPPNPNDPLLVRPTRPVGYALIGVGASAVISGAVLLILDRRKKRNVVQLAPLMQPGSAGLLLVGRF